MSVSVRAATESRWNDVVAVFGKSASPNSCWCQRFCSQHEGTNRAALQQQLTLADIPIGLLAYIDGEPAGWTRVVPRHSLPGVVGNRALRRLLEEDTTAWWVSCFAVRRGYRGRGVGVALLNAAVAHARNQEGSVLDGHPVDTGRLKATPSPSALFTGTLSMFRSAGFHEIGRTYPSRPVMRMTLA